MNPTLNTPLSSLTSFGVGGPAEQLFTCTTNEQLQIVLAQAQSTQVWPLGYGANVLVADSGLPGTTVLIRTNEITREADSDVVIADAGVWWDDLVQFAIQENLWGVELMSGIPGGLGAAIVGNVAAYGQAVANTLQWVEVFDRSSQQTRRLAASDLGLTYRFSLFQTDALKDLVIVRAGFLLSPQTTTELTYQTALDITDELGCDITTLDGRRTTIMETRKRAGSLWDYRTPGAHLHTAGSFFRNPMVSLETAEKLMAYDETGRSLERLKQMNLVHGGDQTRVSAAHVLLGAGFARGQTWGPVRLHPDHILKIENTGGATAQNIYDVCTEIQRTVKTKLGIDLQPEVRFLGNFQN